MRAPIKKNPPKFEIDIKWLTLEQQLKAKIIYMKGGAKRPMMPSSRKLFFRELQNYIIKCQGLQGKKYSAHLV